MISVKTRALIPALVTVVVLGYVGARFFVGVAETMTRTRENACRGLRPDPVPVAFQNQDAPEFLLPDATGKKVSLRAQRGHPVFLNFWATWCPPCVDEMPSMEQLARTVEQSDIRMLAVSVDEGWDVIRKFFVGGTKMGVLLDADKAVSKSYGTEKYPETFLIDSTGRIRHYFINKRDWSKPEALACLESLR
jgi:peroxiredoxin